MVTQKILITTLLAASVAPAPQPMKSTRDITTKTLLELVPSMPQNLKTRFEKFFRQHPMLASVLSGKSYYHTLPGSTHAPFSIDFGKQTSKDKKFLSHIRKTLSDVKSNITKHNSRTLCKNFIIKVDDHWLIKASALFSRRSNILYEMGFNNRNATLPQAKLAAFVRTKGGRTFQTLSRMVYWLRAKQAQEELHLDRICLPQKYLMHIPGRPTDIDDTNYVVVAEKLKGMTPILQTNLLKDAAIITQLTHLILRASLWDIHSGNVLAKNGKACIIDFEQPNACRPSEFGRKNLAEGGIQGLKSLIKKYAQQTKQDLSYLENLVTEIVNSYNN